MSGELDSGEVTPAEVAEQHPAEPEIDESGLQRNRDALEMRAGSERLRERHRLNDVVTATLAERHVAVPSAEPMEGRQAAAVPVEDDQDDDPDTDDDDPPSELDELIEEAEELIEMAFDPTGSTGRMLSEGVGDVATSEPRRIPRGDVPYQGEDEPDAGDHRPPHDGEVIDLSLG